ncbi:hypothetical protein ACM66B_006624 [Microbotryomycetes sp. NB124-2]
MGQAESHEGGPIHSDDPYNSSSGYYDQSQAQYGVGSGTGTGVGGQQQQAFHVLRVADNSPASQAGVDPFFDFVYGINGTALGDDVDVLTDTLEQNEGRQVTLQLYSTKRKEMRDVSVVPSRTWSSSAGQTVDQSGAQPSLLGLSLRLCNPQHALDQVWHVLEVLEGSPAQDAGLVPFTDYVIGAQKMVLRGEGDFYDVVESHIDKPLRLFVYNADYDVTREVILVPNRNWGGEGLLGCGVGYGLLHRIPRPQDRTAIPQDDETDNDESAANSPVPAYGGGRTFQPPPPQPPPQASMYSSPPRATVAPPPPSISSVTSPKRNPPPPPATQMTSPQRTAGRAAVSPPPPTRRHAALSPPRHQQQQQRHQDVYEEATYSPQGEYATSHGVSVVPSADDGDESFNGDNSIVDFSSFAVPADSYPTANTMQVPAGAKGGPRGFMSPLPQAGFNKPSQSQTGAPATGLSNLRSPPRQAGSPSSGLGTLRSPPRQTA